MRFGFECGGMMTTMMSDDSDAFAFFAFSRGTTRDTFSNVHYRCVQLIISSFLSLDALSCFSSLPNAFNAK